MGPTAIGKTELAKILSEIYLKKTKKKLLYIERLDEKKIFYQIEIYKEVEKNEKIKLINEEINFFDYIDFVVERTGEHIPQGDIFYKNIDFPKKLENHHIMKYIEEEFIKNHK